MTQKVSNLVVRNVFFNYCGFVANAFLGFVLSPFLVHELGDLRYGIWALVISLTGYLSVLDLGVRASVVRYVAKYYAENDHEKLNGIINTAFLFFIGVSVLASFIVVLGALFVDSIFNFPIESKQEIQVVILISGASFAIYLPLSIFGGILHAFQRFDITNIYGILVKLIFTALVIVFLKGGYGLTALAILSLLTNNLLQLIFFFYARREFSGLKLSLTFATKKSLLQIFSYSFFIFLSIVSAQISFYTDNAVIGAFLAVSNITVYAIAANLVEYFVSIIRTISGVFNPLASKLDAQGLSEQLQSTFLTGTKYALYICLPVAFTLLLTGDQFISLWMGEKYASEGYPILVLLLLPQILRIAESLSTNILFGIESHRIPSLIGLSSAIINLGLSIVLVKMIGLRGVALGTTIPTVITEIFLIAYGLHVLKIDFRRYLKEVWLVPLAIIPFFAGPYLLFRLNFTPKNLAVYFFWIGAALAVYLAALFALVLRKDNEIMAVFRKFGIQLLAK